MDRDDYLRYISKNIKLIPKKNRIQFLEMVINLLPETYTDVLKDKGSGTQLVTKQIKNDHIIIQLYNFIKSKVQLMDQVVIEKIFK